jgi:hypothetical protein
VLARAAAIGEVTQKQSIAHPRAGSHHTTIHPSSICVATTISALKSARCIWNRPQFAFASIAGRALLVRCGSAIHRTEELGIQKVFGEICMWLPGDTREDSWLCTTDCLTDGRSLAEHVRARLWTFPPPRRGLVHKPQATSHKPQATSLAGEPPGEAF